ncbi:ROK family glucokinase [Neobacillus mesonae]|uniref:ROK family glucokinase n=1 Tax=Neobacillus mesonae TaxID=1193713 RepID=UPI00203BF1A8|nr:ROK family glucokinase [Neobacillus mesonae]MCM3566620.1 ROK family glucokinase [Neobacillus mesonae]
MAGQWVAGVDLGGTTTKFAFITMDGEIVEKWEIPTDNRDEGKNITLNIADSISGKLKGHGKDKEQLAGIGIGAPGPIDYENGIILNTVNLGWQDYFPLQASLQELTALPVLIENDANCAALGEMWMGAGNGAADLVCVTLGTGVGGGIIANGNIVRGIYGAAGEIGHITVIPFGGAPCNCGKTGCLETVASATGIVRLAMEALREPGAAGELAEQYRVKGSITAKDVFDCALSGDLVSKKVADMAALHLGLALANIANTLNPEKIVFGGGVSKSGDFLISLVKTHFDRFAFTSVRNSTKLTLASLENHAGVIGAAWLIKNKLENN